MSQSMTVDGEEVEFVLNDTEFVLDSEISPEGLSDIIYSDGTRAILVNGHGHIIQGEAQAVVLQEGEDLSQYYINDENGEILIADEQDTSVSQSLEGAEIVQYVDEDGNTTDEPQVIYVNEEGFAIQDSDLSQYQIAETQEDDGTFSLKTVKLETQVVDLEELMRQQGEGETAIIDNDDNGYQYAILKDGKLHIQTYSGDVFPVSSTQVIQEQEPGEEELTNEQILDLSKITGRNLLTGQTVTLHSYMDKLQKKIKGTVSPGKKDESDGTRKKKKTVDGLKGLLNKKLTLGKTTTGKRLVGKIIHVEKKDVAAENRAFCSQEKITDGIEEAGSKLEDQHLADIQESSDDSFHEPAEELLHSSMPQSSTETTDEVTGKSESFSDKKKIVIHEKLVSKDCFEHISRTLSGLMNMESVKKKLQHRNIIVKVVEKKYISSTKTYAKNVAYSSGYMQEEFVVGDTGDMMESWTFVPDLNTKEAIFGKSKDGKAEYDQGANKYLETTNLTLMITQEKTNERVIRVSLNTTNSNRCSICAREFRSNLQLRVHINNAHRGNGTLKLCEICGHQFDDFIELQEHRKWHVAEGKLFRCVVNGCGKFFLTSGRLKRHSAVHYIALRPLECSVCLHRCSSESGLKKHLMTHMSLKPFYCETCGKSFTNLGDLNFHKRVHDPYKYYACEICKRTFSRHSNLQRHVEIHKGSGELYQCSICGCSYHYMSSLTRHVVQHHIKRPDADVQERPVDNEPEES